MLKKNGFTEYDILLMIFIKHFKFLSQPSYGSYHLSHYSWDAQEIQVKFYSRINNIEIIFFCDMSSKMEIYLVCKHILFDKSYNLNNYINSKDFDLNLTIDNAEKIIGAAAIFFKSKLSKVLIGKKKIKTFLNENSF